MARLARARGLKRPETGNPNKEPDLHDLKESGDIENMAEHVVLGWVIQKGDDESAQEVAWARECLFQLRGKVALPKKLDLSE